MRLLSSRAPKVLSARNAWRLNTLTRTGKIFVSSFLSGAEPQNAYFLLAGDTIIHKKILDSTAQLPIESDESRSKTSPIRLPRNREVSGSGIKRFS